METLKLSELNENLFQGILVLSCSQNLPSLQWLERIMENSKGNTKVEFQPVLENGTKLLRFDIEKYSHIDPLECHSALLDNKYYMANIYLVAMDKPVMFPTAFCDFFHGAVIYFDNNDEECLNALDQWVDYVDYFENCGIRILACESSAGTDRNYKFITRVDSQRYSIEKGFELIELKPQISQYEDEDDFVELNSYNRLYQAIQAYVWPNLNYKQKGIDGIEHVLLNDTDEVVQKMNRVKFENIDDNDDDEKPSTSKKLEETVPEDEAETFEDIFARFSEMKERASKMGGNDRRRYAENVAINFWKSMSDDTDEISGFSSEEEAEPCHVFI
ncbi:hypothetical protein BLOT_003162 [Blomia tropicalis]|nr:hypothetical protein BLOT_003162 [Blomia tropicalis]